MYEPCPYCLSRSAICEPYHDESYVRCQNCEATGPTGNFKEAGEKWNELGAKLYAQTLTRDQAIKRIRDIQNGEYSAAKRLFPENLKGRLAKRCWHDDIFGYGMEYGAIAELMAIFDIKEEEI